MSQINFNFSIIHDDLRSEETILQISYMIEQYNLTFSKLINQLTNAISSKSKNINDLENRLNLVDFKIKKLKGTSKPIKILSSSKYPSIDFAEVGNRNDNKFLGLVNTRKILKITSQINTLDDAFLKNRHKYFVKEDSFIQDRTSSKYDIDSSSNNKIYSICSILLFNTAEHMYKKINNNNTKQYTDLRKVKKSFFDSDTLRTIDEAPISIIDRDKNDNIKKEDIAFKPKLGSVPDFDVPTILPDLIGIADITFNQQVSSIAPSTNIEMVVDLPEIVLDENKVEDTQPSNQNPLFENNSNSSTIMNLNIPNVSDQPPLMNLNIPNVSEEIIDKIENLKNDKFNAKLDVSSEKVEYVIDEVNDTVTSNDDGRNSLLEQIRSFGGDKTKLKSIENRKVESKRKRQEQKEANLTLNIAEQLKAALTDRRKFIADTDDTILPKFGHEKVKNDPHTENSSGESDSDWNDA